MQKKKGIILRVSPELLKFIKVQAHKRDVSMNRLMTAILEDWKKRSKDPLTSDINVIS